MTLFEFGKEIICECGNRLSLKHEEIFSQFEQDFKLYELEFEEEKLSEIRRQHDKIVSLIMNTDYQEVDIEIEKVRFRDLIKELFPDKAHLYELIYEPRFKRLWEQFRFPSP